MKSPWRWYITKSPTKMSETSETAEMDNTDGEPMELEEDLIQTEIVETEQLENDIEMENENETIEEKPDPVPPLRPLNIAPKPPNKIPLNYKTPSGQQVYVMQGGTVSDPGLKLIPQGLALGNLQPGKTVALRAVSKSLPGSTNFSIMQPKQFVMKKFIPPVSGDSKSTDETAVSTPNSFVLSSPAKTITLAQAQQLGILPATKLLNQQLGNKQTIVLPKAQAKQIKIIPQIKQHAKILPAPDSSPNKIGRFILKPANATATNLMTPGQVIQVSGKQQLVSGQLHQINIPGKGVQYIKILTTSAPSSTTTTYDSTTTRKIILNATNSETGKLPILTPVIPSSKLSSIVLAEPNNSSLKQIKPPARSAAIVPSTGQLLLLPTPKVAIPQIKSITLPRPLAVSEPPVFNDIDANGLRARKPCNCTKSQCLKLYCDCFANGEFCYLCNCNNCSNNLMNEELRQRAIKSCLDRNPNAFRPKIGKAKDLGEAPTRKHTKGCNCKRSWCLKNYCECYEAKIACSSNCKCFGCRNIEDMIDRKLATVQNTQFAIGSQLLPKTNVGSSSEIKQRRLSNKYAFSFITDEVIEATSQCLLTISENAETQDDDKLKQRIIQEFGRCLMEIIECSSNRVTVN